MKRSPLHHLAISLTTTVFITLIHEFDGVTGANNTDGDFPMTSTHGPGSLNNISNPEPALAFPDGTTKIPKGISMTQGPYQSEETTQHKPAKKPECLLASHSELYGAVENEETMFRCAPENELTFYENVWELSLHYRPQNHTEVCALIGRLKFKHPTDGSVPVLTKEIPSYRKWGWHVYHQLGPTPDTLASSFYVAMWVYIPRVQQTHAGSFYCTVKLLSRDRVPPEKTSLTELRVGNQKSPTVPNRFLPRKAFVSGEDRIEFFCESRNDVTVKKYFSRGSRGDGTGNEQGYWKTLSKRLNENHVIVVNYSPSDPNFPVDYDNFRSFVWPLRGQIVSILENLTCAQGTGIYSCENKDPEYKETTHLFVGLAPIEVLSKRIELETTGQFVVTIRGPLARNITWTVKATSSACSQVGPVTYVFPGTEHTQDNLGNSGAVPNNTEEPHAMCPVWNYTLMGYVRKRNETSTDCDYMMRIQLDTVMGQKRLWHTVDFQHAPNIEALTESSNQEKTVFVIIVFTGVLTTVGLTALMSRCIIHLLGPNNNDSYLETELSHEFSARNPRTTKRNPRQSSSQLRLSDNVRRTRSHHL